VFFEQVHEPGREGACDFTHATELGVTIAGRLLVHLLFQLVLSFSKWRSARIAYGETFEALVAGLQAALWSMGGAPRVLRSDNLSAATHELRDGGRTLTTRFAAVLAHYGMRSTRIMPGEAHQNGVAEKANDLLKRALAQALVIRGSSDFPSIEDYDHFVQQVVVQLNRHCAAQFALEQTALLPLPAAKVPEYTLYEAVVRKWSTVRVNKRTYSVPSRLIGHTLHARLYPDVVEVYYRGKLIETMERLRGERDHRIDYRHVIWSLVRKPGAFAQYRYRDDLYPSLSFRRAYDALCASRPQGADRDYVRLLHLAASTSEDAVAVALELLLDQRLLPTFDAVRDLVREPVTARLPVLGPVVLDLRVYDRLLATIHA
jgi:hypothetical protein